MTKDSLLPSNPPRMAGMTPSRVLTVAAACTGSIRTSIPDDGRNGTMVGGLGMWALKEFEKFVSPDLKPFWLRRSLLWSSFVQLSVLLSLQLPPIEVKYENSADNARTDLIPINMVA